MPNHVHNDLWIFGPAEEVKELLAHIGADRPQPDFDFNALIPYPDDWALVEGMAQAIARARKSFLRSGRTCLPIA